MEIEIKSMEETVTGTRIVAIIHDPVGSISEKWDEIKKIKLLHLGEAELTQKEENENGK